MWWFHSERQRSGDCDLQCEQVDRTRENPEGKVTVIQSDVLLTLCARDGNLLDRQLLQKVLQAGQHFSEQREAPNGLDAASEYV